MKKPKAKKTKRRLSQEEKAPKTNRADKTKRGDKQKYNLKEPGGVEMYANVID